MSNYKLKFVKSAAALALGASVITSAVVVADTSASAKTTYKVSKGKLVYAKTNKAVSGYKVYKSVLYKSGKAYTGTYKSKYYKSGKLFTGVVSKTYYKNGVKATGTYKGIYYKSGKAFSGYVGQVYYYQGKKFTGVAKSGIYLVNGIKYTGFKGQVYYYKGKPFTGVAKSGNYLINGLYANEIYTINGVNVEYKNGKVVADKTAPVITLEKGSEDSYKVKYGEEFTAPKATAKDNLDKTVNVVTSITDAEGNKIDKIDTNVAGLYTITYTAQDRAKNASAVQVSVEVEGIPFKSVNALNENTVVVPLSSDFKLDLKDKKITLTTDKTSVTATYVSTDKDVASFKLDGDAKLVDAKEYTVTSDWAKFETGFVAKIATPHVASFEKVTTGISAKSTDSALTFEALDQYGEKIALPAANTSAKVTVNGLSTSSTYNNGIVTIQSTLHEGDTVNVTLTYTDGAATPKTLAEDTFDYTVGATEAVKVSKLTVNPTKVSLPAKESTPLNVSVIDQFNSKIADSAVTYQVNGKVVTVDGADSPIQTIDGKVSFQTSTPGEYKIEVFSQADSKVQDSATITVGSATLTGLTVTPVANAAANNFESADLGTVKPNEGAALVASNVKFSVTSATPGFKAEDVTVTTGTDKDGNITVSATASKAGQYTVTPYVGESFTAETAIKGSSFTFTSSKLATVASISPLSFTAKELKTGNAVKKEIVFKNKHDEVLTAAEANASDISSNTSVISNADITSDEAGKTYVEFTPSKAGQTRLSVEADNQLSTALLNVVDSVVNTIDAGSDVTGVVAGDASTFAKYNTIKFFDQDGTEMANQAATVSVAGLPTGVNASELVTLGTATKDQNGNVTNFVSTGLAYNAVKVNPSANVPAGTYTVTVKNNNVSKSFKVTVGAARALTATTVETDSSKLVLNGTTEVLVKPVDQYGNIVAENKVDGITLGENANVSLVKQGTANFTAVKEDGKLLGYKVIVKGDEKGSTTATFNVVQGSGTTAVTKSATQDFTVASADEAISSISIADTALTSAEDASTDGIDLAAKTTVKDTEGNKVSVDNAELTWSVKSVKDVNGNVYSKSATDTFTANVNGVTNTVKVTVDNGVLKVTDSEGAAIAGLKIAVEAQVESANLKTTSTTVTVDGFTPAYVSGLKLTTAQGAPVNAVAINDKKAATVSFEGVDQFGKSIDVTPTLSSGDKSVVTVNGTTITPVGNGTATVYAKYGNDTVKVTVTVTNQEATPAQ